MRCTRTAVRGVNMRTRWVNFHACRQTKLTMSRRLLSLILLLPLPLVAVTAHAMGVPLVAQSQADAARSTPKTGGAKARAAATPQVRAPMVVTGTGAGQSGYVHYWLITAPNGDQEVQVGIELPDQRIVWSFPGVGVTVAPFIANGGYDANGRPFTVQHQYGLRPYRNEAAVRRLQAGLQRRVQPWIDNAVPYCELNGVSREVCVSCFGFAAQILYPGKTKMYAEFPRDFPRLSGEEYHTTEDLLLYLAGLHALPNDTARRQRMAKLGGPPALHEELTRLSALAVNDRPTAVASSGATKRRSGATTPARSGTRTTARPG